MKGLKELSVWTQLIIAVSLVFGSGGFGYGLNQNSSSIPVMQTVIKSNEACTAKNKSRIHELEIKVAVIMNQLTEIKDDLNEIKTDVKYLRQMIGETL